MREGTPKMLDFLCFSLDVPGAKLGLKRFKGPWNSLM